MEINVEQPGRVESIHLSLRTRQPAQRVELATAVAAAGLDGCRHSKPGNDRAVLVIEAETLDELGLALGDVKENITTRGIELASLAPGAELRIGDAVRLEVTGPCAPCRRMDEIRSGLQDELRGRRGINTRVIAGGEVRTGDPIRVIKPGRRLP